MPQELKMRREALPIQDRLSKGKPAIHASDSEVPAYKPLRPPEDAPNVAMDKIEWVRGDLKDDDISHLEGAEHIYHRIMARR